jgi:glycerol-3-phosphate acyltransferase PlsX
VADSLVISVDAMGGDHGVAETVPALALALKRAGDRNLRFLLHGDEARIYPALSKATSEVRNAVDVRHAEKVIAGDEKPAQAMRRGKGSSMWNAIQSVKDGEAIAVVSGGNTGALMAISKLQLRMAADLDRPAIVAAWPTTVGITAVLDVGANIDCDAERLTEFAIMGAAFHRALYGTVRPTVGLLNVGSEDEKGHEDVKGAHRLLRETPLHFDYHGFVEGTDIAKGTVDVIVTDGFTGNVALKTAEGLARFFIRELRDALTSDLCGRAGALFAAPALRRMAERLRPPAGGPLLGLNGIVVKSHGGADARGFAEAIGVAADLARSNFIAEISRDLERLTTALSPPAVAEEKS